MPSTRPHPATAIDASATTGIFIPRPWNPITRRCIISSSSSFSYQHNAEGAAGTYGRKRALRREDQERAVALEPFLHLKPGRLFRAARGHSRHHRCFPARGAAVRPYGSATLWTKSSADVPATAEAGGLYVPWRREITGDLPVWTGARRP